jgi:hypothetical protein
MMTQLNGQAHDLNQPETISDTIEDIRALASKIPTTVVERVPNNGTVPFDQKTHDLMIESVDRITTQWIDELVALRKNSEVIEQMVIEQATKVKGELTKLHLLGAQAMREAQRGHDVLQRLGDELDAMMSGHARAA